MNDTPVWFIAHARERLMRRGVSEDDVAVVLKNPAIVLPARRARRDVIGYVRGRPLRVIYADLGHAFLVITTYWVTE